MVGVAASVGGVVPAGRPASWDGSSEMGGSLAIAYGGEVGSGCGGSPQAPTIARAPRERATSGMRRVRGDTPHMVGAPGSGGDAVSRGVQGVDRFGKAYRGHEQVIRGVRRECHDIDPGLGERTDQ